MATQSPMGRIIGINLAVMLAYAIAIKLLAAASGGNEEQLTFVILLGLAAGVHATVDLIVAAVLGLSGRRDPALAFLASAPLVLLVGAGVCFGGAAIDLGGGRGR
jgi:hypothetical protein